MRYTPLNRRIVEALDVLDALYFFLQSVQANQGRLSFLRSSFERAPFSMRMQLFKELQSEIDWLRRESGALAKNSEYVEFYAHIEKAGDQGHLLLPKWEIERRWFSRFERIIVRWPHVKDHAMVVYDPRNFEVRNQLFELEGAIFKDANLLLEQAKKFHKGISDFRKRAREDQFLLHAHLRSAATVGFHFVEAYVNGLAFDCLLRHHDRLSQEEHDALTEWDSTKKTRRFVPIERKIFRYPSIFGNCLGVKIDLSGCRAAHYLANEAKELRDALTHPSPHLDREDRTLKKVGLMATITLSVVHSIVDAARDYATTVEKTLFGHPEETAPWLFATSQTEISAAQLVREPDQKQRTDT